MPLEMLLCAVRRTLHACWMCYAGRCVLHVVHEPAQSRRHQAWSSHILWTLTKQNRSERAGTLSAGRVPWQTPLEIILMIMTMIMIMIMSNVITHPFGLTVILPSSLASQTMMIVIIYQPSGPDSVPLSVHPPSNPRPCCR